MLRESDYMSIGDLTKPRKDAIAKECNEIREKYKFDSLKISTIANFYVNHISLKTGNIIKSLDCIVKVLESFGMNEEEISNYIRRHSRMYLCNYNNMLIKLAIVNKCNQLEELFYGSANLVNYESTLNGVNKEFMYALAKSRNFEITPREFMNPVRSDIKKQLLQQYKLTKEEAIELLREFKGSLSDGSILKKTTN